MKFVTADEMREIDRQATEKYGISSLILMENAGRVCAEEAVKMLHTRFLPPIKGEERIAIFCGKGNNGGDGFVVARHLHNQGFYPVVFYFQVPSNQKSDLFINFKILETMNVERINYSVSADWNQIIKITQSSRLIVDALFGTGLSKPVEDPYKNVIRLMNESKVPILAVDIPSGMNADTGEVMGICVRAKRTVTLGLPKKAFSVQASKRYTGQVIVADISIPKELL